MTSGALIRLWLIAGPDIDRLADAATAVAPVVNKIPPPESRAGARIEPTVTEPPSEALEAHVGMVYRYVMRLAGRADLAEDLTQETLLRAWRRRHSLRDPQTARVWLLRIATNVWTDHLRQRRFRPQVLAAEPACPRPTAAVRSEHEEHVAQALAAMDQLPPRQRQVLFLISCEGLAQAEVAEVLSVDTAAVKSSLSLARREMRRRMKDVYDQVCGRGERAETCEEI